ncbi:hypothetical protein RB601_000529 [Gaeumannomyces tritici]
MMSGHKESEQFDYIVVGSGSAGSVVASRLTEDPAVRVLVLEAGPPDDDANIHRPSGWPAAFKTHLDWAVETVPQKHTAGWSHYLPRGRTLGGSSSLNAMIYVRGARADYDAWAYLGSPGWSYDEVLPYFKKSEDHELGASEHHGAGGPLHVAVLKNVNPVCAAAVEACKEIGLPFTDDCNGDQMLGASYVQATVTPNGSRCSTARCFLRPALERGGNLAVYSGAHAHRVLFEGTRAVGVRYDKDGAMHDAFASREVIVSAGAIKSPQLLQLSGIGNAGDLRALGIDVVADLPGVGENLQDHVLASVIYEGKQAIPPPENQMLESQLFWKSDPRLVAPDLQPLFMHIPYYPPGFEGPANAYTLCAGIVRPASRGSVKLASADPDAPPAVDPNYLAQAADVEALLAAVKLCRQVGEAEALAGWRAREVLPGPEVQTDEQLRDYVRRACVTYHHQAGTCKMGVDAMAVVDPELRVYGVTGLRVVDASIMPLVVSGNTNAPSIMIGEKGADMIKQSAAGA